MRFNIIICLLCSWMLSGCILAVAGVGAAAGYAVVQSTKEAKKQANETLATSPSVHPETARIKAAEAKTVTQPRKPAPVAPQIPKRNYNASDSEVRYIYPEGYFKEGAPR